MTNLYRNAAEGQPERGFAFDETVVTEMLHAIHDKQIDVSTQIDEGLYNAVHKVFNDAAAQGLNVRSSTDAGADFLRQVERNNGVFAAFKTHRFQNDVARQLLDGDGKLKSFEQFRTDTRSIVSHHKDAWLRTEYDTAVKRARKASEMRRFMDEADVLPNLRWLPSTAINPREEHKPFYDRVWPIDAPFWEEHRPGDEWGCQCDWEATDDPVTDNRDIDPTAGAPSPGLGGDPARTGQLFSDDHPYFPESCASCPFNNAPLKVFRNKAKDCYACPGLSAARGQLEQTATLAQHARLKADPNYTNVVYDKKSGGLSAVHKDHKFDSVKGIFGIKRGDYEQLATDVLRKKGYTIILESEQAATSVKTPDGTLNGVVMDIKAIEGVSKWTIKNKFESANKQGATCVVLYFHSKDMYSDDAVRTGWNSYVNAPYRETQIINKVICVVEANVYEFIP